MILGIVILAIAICGLISCLINDLVNAPEECYYCGKLMHRDENGCCPNCLSTTKREDW